MNRSDCAHRNTPGNCPWGWCVNSKPRYRIVAMSKKEAEELMSYVDSRIQRTERLIEERSSEVAVLQLHLKSLREERKLALLDVVGDRTVIRFTKTFGSGKQYHYAGIKSDGFWYITSNGYEYRKTLPELKKFIGDNPIDIMKPDKEL